MLPSPLEPLAGESLPGMAAARDRLRALGVEPSTWSNGAGDRYGVHDHPYDKLLVCAEGSITFFIGEAGTPVALGPGDGVMLPAGTRHAALVGPAGCTCLEGHPSPA